MKSQLGVWQFYYEKRDIRDKTLHPAAFPISLARKAIDLFTHRGELVLDPFAGSGTTLLAARDAGRNALGFDLQKKYVALSEKRLETSPANGTLQRAHRGDAREIPKQVEPESVKLIFTSPPYANLLNRPRANKSRRTVDRKNAQLGKVAAEMESIFRGLLPLLKPKAHCVINVPDMWLENRRITIHISIVDALRRAGYELRNIIIWDRTNIVNRIGIFGWPSNYITMGVTFEYLLDFWRPPRADS
jgi:DNA modification methylase